MIALRLGEMSGGARTFRYGGEEFTAVFAGKSIEDAIAHVEKFSKAVENTPFTVRGRERRTKRRNRRVRKGGIARKQVKVTVSIGLASPDGPAADPQKVIKTADKKLSNRLLKLRGPRFRVQGSKVITH